MALQRCKSVESVLQQETVEAIESPKGIIAKIRIVLNNITVEPMLLCYTFPSIMCMYAVQNLNLEKVCRVNLNYTTEVCDAMYLRNKSGYTDDAEIEVQKYVAEINAYKHALTSFLPPFMLLFLGSWSDRHGKRKPCMFLALAGDCIAAVLCLISVYFYYELPAEFNIFAEGLPQGLAGSWLMMYMAVSSYISSVSGEDTRTLRLGALHIFSSVCCAIGTVLSGLLYKLLGCEGVLCISLCLYGIGIAYLHLKVDEVAIEKEDDTVEERGSGLKDIFELRHVLETFKVAFKDGKKNRRKRICTIMVLVILTVGPGWGEYGVLYLYMRYRFGWNEVDYSIFSTYSMITHMLGTMFYLTLFNKILKVDDSAMGMISCLSKILAAFIFAFAPSGLIFCLGILVEMLNGTSFIAMRSIMSKLAAANELGKLNSLFSIADGIAPLAYGPLYTIIYNRMIDTFPGFFFILGGILTTPSVLIFFWLYKEHTRDLLEEAAEKEAEQFLKKGEKNVEQENTEKLKGKNGCEEVIP